MITERHLDIIKKEIVKLYHPTEAIRIFHGRYLEDLVLKQLVIESFPPLIEIRSYREIEGVEKILKILPPETKLVYHQKRYHTRAQRVVLLGPPQEKMKAFENSLTYELRFSEGQNIGFFLDSAEIRAYLLKNSQSKHILNLFSYTCSLSVAALKGGAKKVINIDLSKSSLEWGRKNHQINHIDKKKSEFYSHNILKSFGFFRRKGPYDLIILDPPSFQKNSFSFIKDYPKLIRKISPLLKEKGLLIVGLNEPKLCVDEVNEMVLSSGASLEFSFCLISPKGMKEPKGPVAKFLFYQSLISSREGG